MSRNLTSKSFLKYILFIVFFFGIIHDALKIPGALVYTIDIALIFALIIGRRKLSKPFQGSTKFFAYFTLVYFLVEFLLYLPNLQSPLYFLFGTRNLFRFYVFFLFSVYVFSEKDVEKFYSKLDVIFYINTAFMLVEYFVFGFEQDLLGGIFGVSRGCNGSLNVFFIIYTSYVVLRYLKKELSLKSMALRLAIILLLCALSELKIYYFELILIILFSMVFTRFSFRKIAVVLFSIIGIIVGVNLLTILFPDFAGFFSLKEVIRITTTNGYSSYESINRFTFIPFINRLIFNNPVTYYIGLGLGNCETSSISILQTPFFERYELLRYDWLTAAHTYLEQGYIGMVMYLAFFIAVFIVVRRMEKKATSNKVFFQVAEVVSLLCLVLFIYNSSLKDEISYLIYFVFAVPFIVSREKMSTNNLDKTGMIQKQ